MKQFTSTNQWVNQQVGYGLASSIVWTSPWKFGSAPGELPFPYGNPYTKNATYAISFPGLIAGLTYIEDVHTAPGTYQVPNNTCCTIARSAGAASGITLPDDPTPEFFGVYLPPSSP
jgi:hypothetical protein